ncbi:guanine nucleotide binding protein, alpha subunit [Spinellus fusiger]|nr:guanine nucleotide binding protein, alpha subunit [Spinellus fusiger]
MGCCQSSGFQEEKARNKEIEKQIRQDKLSMNNQVKMLLLGAGESGKSTILKQMKLIHDGGYTIVERKAYKKIIFSNILQSMQKILKTMKSNGVWLNNAVNWNYAALITELSPHITEKEFSSDIIMAIKILWDDPNLQTTYRSNRGSELSSCSNYFFYSIDRIGSAKYIPTDQDILQARVKTTGITETVFEVGSFTYRIFDVGGQRSERKKWIHCFDNVTAVIFMAALSEYNQVLIEDETINRIDEGLTLFQSICDSKWFLKTSIILFLNKKDIFKEKLESFPLKMKFPDYLGPNEYEPASDYILHQFVSLNQSKKRQIYTHITCATDTQQIKFVMSTISEIILNNNLKGVGVL